MRSGVPQLAGFLEDRNANALKRAGVGVSRRGGFTLIELLVVISIMTLIAALAVPAVKSLGKSNVRAGATRQLLDDIGRARQLAIAQHTTVYMVFVPTNFFTRLDPNNRPMPDSLDTIVDPVERMVAKKTMTNLVDSQLTGYNFLSYGHVGDQPGQHSWHYLGPWQSFPSGTFISPEKFQLAQNFTPKQIQPWQADYLPLGQIDNWRRTGNGLLPQIYPFTNYTAYLPFPTDKSTTFQLPYIAFDYTGRLISEYDTVRYHHAYIPLAEGTVGVGIDLNKQPTLDIVKPTDILEVPAGNSGNMAYRVIDVDPLSGRARVLTHQIP